MGEVNLFLFGWVRLMRVLIQPRPQNTDFPWLHFSAFVSLLVFNVLGESVDLNITILTNCIHYTYIGENGNMS